MRKIAFALSLIFIFTIPWEGMIEIPGIGTAAKVIGFVLAVFWILTVIITNRLRKPSSFQIVFCFFVLWNVISVFWSANPDDTTVQAIRWIQLLIMVFILWDIYTTRTALLAGLQAFILGEFVAIGSALQNFLSGDVFYSTYQRFSPADQSNPDGFGVIVALGIPIAWYLASSINTNKISGLLKFVNYAYIPAAFLGISLSGTRTALIASIVGMTFGLVSLTRLRLWVRITLISLLGAVFIFLLPQVKTLKSFQRFGTTVNEITEGDLNNRTNTWGLALVTFIEHPILGVGSNMFTSLSRGRMAHNSFISVLVELGLIGLVIFGTILTIAFIHALRQPAKWDSGFWFTLLLVWAICASSLTYEHRKATWLFLSFVVASATVASHNKETESVIQNKKSGRVKIREKSKRSSYQGV